MPRACPASAAEKESSFLTEVFLLQPPWTPSFSGVSVHPPVVAMTHPCQPPGDSGGWEAGPTVPLSCHNTALSRRPHAQHPRTHRLGHRPGREHGPRSNQQYHSPATQGSQTIHIAFQAFPSLASATPQSVCHTSQQRANGPAAGVTQSPSTAPAPRGTPGASYCPARPQTGCGESGSEAGGSPRASLRLLW